MGESIALMGWSNISVQKNERIENTSSAFHKPDALWDRNKMQRMSSQLAVMLALNLSLYEAKIGVL